MGFGQGRSDGVAFMEDYATNLRITILQSVQLFNKEIDIVNKECKEYSEKYGGGDKEVETDVFNSMYKYSSIGVLDEHLSFLRSANFCFIYNTYEKLLKFIISEYNIPHNEKDRGSDSIAFHQLRSIKSYLGIELFDSELECLIDRLDDEYRKIRVNLSHGESKDIPYLKELLKEEPDIYIGNDEILFHGDDYILSFLENVIETLSFIVNQVDIRTNEK